MTLTTIEREVALPITPVEMPVKTDSDILDHAALILEERGWTTDQYGADASNDIARGPHCAVGAIMVAYGDNTAWDGSPAETALADFLGINSSTVESWNDKNGRTQAEVICALRGAAAANR